MTVAITREELGAVELRREAGRCRDARAARRMLALALVLEGRSRAEAARAAGMDRQTLRDWVHRYNAEGLAGLRDRRRPGPRPRLTPEREAELATAVERGPDPERDGVVRWRRVDLQALIETRFTVRLHERSVGWRSRRPPRRGGGRLLRRGGATAGAAPAGRGHPPPRRPSGASPPAARDARGGAQPAPRGRARPARGDRRPPALARGGAGRDRARPRRSGAGEPALAGVPSS